MYDAGPPNINGGNMDNRHMCEGSVAYYPVFVEGEFTSNLPLLVIDGSIVDRLS